MNPIILLFVAGLAFFAGWCFAMSQEECPQMIMGYKCKQDFCNHCKNEVDKAKALMQKKDPPTNFNFRP